METKIKKVMSVQEFEALNPKEKKVIVAKDVIAQVNAKKYLASTGRYINPSEKMRESLDLDVKENFDKVESCYVCGVGACVLSITKFANKLTFKDIDMDILSPDSPEERESADKVENLLTSVFTIYEIAKIESYFEGGSPLYANIRLEHEDDENWELVEEGEEFYEKYPDDNERMIAIMEEIIEENS